jgi:putative endonuclease
MEYVVYILYSESISKYYVGQTQDITNRILRHNAGRENFTSKGLPWKLIYTFNCTDRSDAVRLESKIKKRGIERYLQDNNLQ